MTTAERRILRHTTRGLEDTLALLVRTPLYPDVEVQLLGEDGNALMIIGRVMAALRKAGVPRERITEFSTEAMAGDYNGVLRTAMRWVSCN